MALSGIPADAPPGGDRHSFAVWPGCPTLACDDQEELWFGGGMRSDDPARLDAQAGQADLAVARRDTSAAESFAAVSPDDPLTAVESEDLHRRLLPRIRPRQL